uniref:Uncharacterized protein n=1 Tax=Triticum urartu TaxID=4572 RepID=A0A8R7UD89_TRIUA
MDRNCKKKLTNPDVLCPLKRKMGKVSRHETSVLEKQSAGILSGSTYRNDIRQRSRT